ncbi:hypothetical protein [Cognatiluteimonas profundi]|uniref:hypothetical protein n=1 Tax=Cognatiluteimonas profundi TaxID=2594501 RepID=UPI00131CE373|nr:hypothetical protein [Lysobacter profundi]
MEAAVAPRKPPFRRYANLGGHSPVAAYALLPDGIELQFSDGRIVLYNHDCPGRRHVSRMKVLAREGRGLDAYVVRHVGKRFAALLDAGHGRAPRVTRATATPQSSTRQNAAFR